ncbi:MAG: Mrp/NBP35 family ATP-binding protein [Planctomycetales bacterium]
MSTAQATQGALLNAVQQVQDPEFKKTLGSLRAVSGVVLKSDTSAEIQVALPTYVHPQRDLLESRILDAVKSAAPAVTDPQVKFSVKLKGKDSGGALGLKVKNVIAVGSGKGGVGKSTIAASLAFGLLRQGAAVGLMDADVYGPSIPHMLAATGQPGLSEIAGPEGKPIRRIHPIDCQGLKVMSMGFFVPAEEAVVWRGPMLHGAITQFLRDTEWGELDYLIIDLPPGTGDVSLTLSQLLGLAGAVVVCTPQQIALLDAVKAIAMFGKVKIPVLGIVENMTGDIFGRGGAHQKAEAMGIPFLGEVPMNPQLRINADEGKLAENFAPDNPSRPYLEHVCEQVAIQVAKELIAGSGMPTLEVL